MCNPFAGQYLEDAHNSDRSFAKILDCDHSLYGITHCDSLTNTDSDMWQQAVDLVIDRNNLMAEDVAAAGAVCGAPVDELEGAE